MKKDSIENIKAERWFRYDSSTVTMKTWPEIINSAEELPENYKNDFILDKKSFPYSVHIPENYTTKKIKTEKTNSRLVSLLDDSIILYEDLKDKIQITRCLFKDIAVMEFGSVLLRAWIEINTENDSYLIVFNASQKEFFEPLVKKFRFYVSNLKEVKTGSKDREVARFNFLEKIDFKLMNYGAKSVINGISINDILYQEKIFIKRIKIFNFVLFEKFISAHLAVLTDKELVFVKEEKDIFTNRDAYLGGGVYDYISIDKIRKISYSDSEFPGVALITIEAGSKIIQSYYDKNNNDAINFFNKMFSFQNMSISECKI